MTHRCPSCTPGANPVESTSTVTRRLPPATVVPEVSETTALGAAYLAGIATGVWSLGDVSEMWREQARYEPAMGQDEREGLLARWRKAVARSREWTKA